MQYNNKRGEEEEVAKTTAKKQLQATTKMLQVNKKIFAEWLQHATWNEAPAAVAVAVRVAA